MTHNILKNYYRFQLLQNELQEMNERLILFQNLEASLKIFVFRDLFERNEELQSTRRNTHFEHTIFSGKLIVFHVMKRSNDLGRECNVKLTATS